MYSAPPPAAAGRFAAGHPQGFSHWPWLIIALIALREWALWQFGPGPQDNRHDLMQLLTVQDMQMPWSSMLFMHHQPPLWCVLERLSHDLFGDQTLLFLINKAGSYITALCVRQVLLPWAGTTRANLAALAFLLLPETAIYEAWDYSSHFIMMLVAVNIFVFSMMVRHPAQRARWAWGWVLNFLVLAFTRQTYAIFVLIPVLWAFGTLALQLPRRTLLMMTLVLAAPVLAWQGKNAWLFGTSSMSSWATQNFYKIAIARLTPDQLKAAEAAGCGPVTTITPFSQPLVYEAIPQVQAYVAAHQHLAPLMPQGVARFNSLLLPAAAPLYKDALVCILQRHPLRYLLAVSHAWGMYFAPSSDYFGVKPIAQSWPRLDKAVRLAVYWQPFDDPPHERNAFKRLAGRSLMLLIVFGYFSVLALRSLMDALKARQDGSGSQGGMPRRRIILVYVMALVMVNGLSNFADFGENMRFRYEVAFAYHLGIVLLYARAWDFLAQRFGRRPAVGPVADESSQTGSATEAADAMRRRA